MSAPTRLLVVDDDELLRGVLASMLRREGFACEVASDGDDGLARMRTAAFDLVITDLRMPTMGGLEMIAAARSELPSTPLFILMSGYHDCDEDTLRAAGVSRILNKPMRPGALLACVHEVLARSR